MMKRLWIVTLIAALGTAAPAAACPNCKAAVLVDEKGNVKPPEQAGDYSKGINTSIFFMLGAIYGVFGAAAFLIVRAYRNYEPGMTAGAPRHPGA
ncbi:MAG: hypothetical protein HYY25_14545 [Candidatus Wallbacteria bacterium]|nr:hypothetical protein [Candidatus Wallbacteria bacterium]